jgi:Na+/H+-dicarboxylate symporter
MTEEARRQHWSPRGVPVVARILIAIALGVFVGELQGVRASPLALVGSTILEVIKGLAGPLLFFAILDAFLRTTIRGRDAGKMVTIAAINASFAIVIGLTISNVFEPGKHFQLGDAPASGSVASEFRSMRKLIAPDRSIDFTKEIIGYIPTSLLRPFVDNAIISIVVLAILGGAALRKVKDEQIRAGKAGYRAIEDTISATYRGIEISLGWVVTLIPLAVFGVVARTVGLYGFRSFRGVIPYVAVGILGLLIQNLVIYQGWLILVARMSPRKFWAGGRDALATAVGTGSSLASLPVTLRSLDRMGISPRSARMAACVGTNLNNDGILLYEAMAVLFVAQAIGVDLSLGQQVVAAVACIFAGIGISGVPDAGLISLLIVLKTVRLPEEAVSNVVPFLLAVDWVLGRCRSTTNVASDMLVAVLLDHLDGDKGSGGDHLEENYDPSGI